MNNGAFGENFPYSNFHDLNTDWIIKIAKDFLDQYTHIQEIIESGETSLQNLTESGLESLQNKATELEGLLQEWYDDHSTDIQNQLATALEEMQTALAETVVSFTSQAEEKAAETIASIPADYSSFVGIVRDMPIFSPESENPPLVDCDIIKVVPSKLITNTDYKIGLRAIGTLNNNILIAITKDCLDYGTPNYSRLLAQLYTPISNIPNGINTITIPKVSANADIDYEITLDCTKLKNNASQNNTGVYFNVPYLNMEYIISQNQYYKYMDSIAYIPDNFLYRMQYVKNLFVQVPGSVCLHEFYLYTMGYSTTYNRFYITLYDNTTGQVDCLAYKDYASMPTDGVETIEFTNYTGGAGTDYKFILTIDWKLYDTSYFFEFQSDNAPIIRPINSDFSKTFSGAGVVKGTIFLNSEITLYPNQHLIGDECKIICTPNAKINMADNSCIEGIEFVGPWSVNRTHGDGETYTQYGYVPLISMNDLSTENATALFGDGSSVTDAFININYQRSNVTIKNCTFRNFNKPVIHAGGQAHEHDHSPSILYNHFIDCRMGVAVYGQFEKLIGNQYLRCVIGTMLHDGNSNHVGEEYTCCDCGIFYPSNAGAHNEITSVHICHCGLAGIYAILIDTNLGATMTGCHMADAPIIGESISNLLITASRLDTFFKYLSGARNSIVLNNVRKAYLYDNPLYSVPSDTQISLNRGMGSTTDSEVNN